MLTVSLRWLIAATTASALFAVALRNPTHEGAVCVLLIPILLAGRYLVGIVLTDGDERAFHMGAFLFSVGTLLVSFGVPLPPSMYLCGPPFGIRGFWLQEGLGTSLCFSSRPAWVF